MKIKVIDLMSSNVVKVQPHHTVEQAREKFSLKKIKSAPVVGPEDHLLGIVSFSDLVEHGSEHKPLSSVMTKKVYSIPEYEGVEIAAKLMRKHKIHHLIVTKEQKVVGIISSYDLLKLIESHQFVKKNNPTPNKHHKGKRRTDLEI